VSETEFQRQVLNQLIRIETKQDALIQTVSEHDKKIDQHAERITVTEQSAKSAHHRLDGIFVTAGIMGTMAGGLVQIISLVWPKGGGHG
jgi:hypothetical protein